MLQHKSVTYGRCLRSMVKSPDRIRFDSWTKISELLLSQSYVSMADIVDISSIPQGKMIWVCNQKSCSQFFGTDVVRTIDLPLFVALNYLGPDFPWHSRNERRFLSSFTDCPWCIHLFHSHFASGNHSRSTPTLSPTRALNVSFIERCAQDLGVQDSTKSSKSHVYRVKQSCKDTVWTTSRSMI